MAERQNWTRGETILAFMLYCQIPRGQDRADNPKIIALAEKTGKSPKSVKAKLQNFKTFDPDYAGRGLTHTSKLDAEICAEFQNAPEALLAEAEAIARRIGFALLSPPDTPRSGTERVALQKQRIGQDFFRSSLLAAYQGRCAITGISTPELLRAAHIKPWAESDSNEKINPCNGILLNALCDAAFDKGLIGFDQSFRLMLSAELLRGADTAARQYFVPLQGQKLRLPDRFLPEQKFLDYHRQHIFKG